MASNIPVIRQIAWVSVVPQLLLMGLFIYIFHLLQIGNAILWGTLTYLILSFGLRSIVTKYHQQGMKLVLQNKFLDAIPLFEQSVEFLTRYSWVDKYRYITLLSSSKITYKEMGLCNIAFCYSQTNDGLKAKEYYERILEEFPESGIAIAALNMMRSAEQNT